MRAGVERVAVLVVAAALAWASWAGVAAAQSESPARVTVRGFEGARSALVRRAVVRTLAERSEIELVPRSEVQSAARALGVDLERSGDYVRVARELDLDAFVEGRVGRTGRGWRARIEARDGASGRVADSMDVSQRSGRALLARVRRGYWASQGEALTAARAPAPVAAASTTRAGGEASAGAGGSAGDGPARSRVEPEPSEDDASDTGGGRAAIVAAVEAEAFTRDLRYADDLFERLHGYRLSGAPAVVLTARWFPAAHFTDGWASGLGLSLSWSRAFALDSAPEQSGGEAYDTSSERLEMGARLRHAFGPADLGLAVGWGRHSFAIDEGPAGPSGSDRSTVAGVGYEYVRLGGLGSFALVERLSLDLELAWLFVRDLGELGSERWFPRAEGAGAEARVGFRFALGAGLEVRLAGRWRRYFMSMHAEPGDARVAGGAVDQYLAATLGLGWRL